jgi:very-short-patch-repair endonuclease
MLYEKLITAANAKISDPKLRIVAAIRLAKLPKYDALFAKNTGKIISMNLSTLDLDRLIDALFAFSEMNHRDEKLISRLVFAIKYQLDKGGASLIDPRQLSTLIVASSRLRMIDEQFYEILLTRIFEHISMFNSERALCNTLFAMASAVGSDDWKDETGWFVPVATELVGRLPEQLSVEGVRQIQIFSMTVKLKNIVFSDSSVVRKLDQIELVNTFSSNTPSIEQSSVPHREISKFLIQLGLEHRNEATIGPFSLDIFVPESRTVVEIDGPHHFFRDSTLRTSSSVLKHRILESFGYHVMHVPYHEWLQCNSDTKKLAYCTDLVAAIRLHAGTV